MIFAPSARWIWLNRDTEAVNQYVHFHRRFPLSHRPQSATLEIAVDTQYALFINGCEVPGRAFSDYPHHRSVDRHDIAPYLVAGTNSIAILAFFFGRSNSEYRKGHPGLIVQIKAGTYTIESNREWKVRQAPGFTSGMTEPVTPQMGFTTHFDARREDDWMAAHYRAGRGWKDAVELAGPTDGYWTHLEYRRQRQLEQGPLHLGTPIACGCIIRPPYADPTSPALAMAADFKNAVRPPDDTEYPLSVPVPAAPANGRMVLVDLQEESFGLFYMDIDAPAGTLVDISHGEHLSDLGVRPAPGNRRFGDRYLCRQGRHRFPLPFRRLGCRYIEIHLLNFKRPVTIHALGLLPVSYPVTESGAYESPDHLMGTIRAAAIRTLKRCMADHYMDCPWREQSLYAYDSRNQALYGYYALGEYTYPLQSFRLLGWGKRQDGLLELCAPAQTHACIPIFSLVWISALRDHYLFSGQPVLFREFRETVADLLQTFLDRQDPDTGLYQIFNNTRYWTFYEWTDGLTSKRDHRFRLDAPHNLYVLEALQAYADLLEYEGEAAAAIPVRRKAAALRRAIHRVFWDAGRVRYASFANREKRWHYATGVQGLALSLGVCPPAGREPLRQAILSDASMVPVTLSALFYAWQAMRGANPTEQVQLLESCMQTFGSMVLEGDTTLSEVVGGDASFQLAGSFCHGWSAAPIWLQQAYILGVRPSSPGFETFEIEPHPCGLPCASGTVPTPHGPIQIAWEIDQDRFKMKLHTPGPCSPTVRRPVGFKGKGDIRINGRQVGFP